MVETNRHGTASMLYLTSPAGGASRRLLGPRRAGDNLAIQKLHPAHDRTERVWLLPGRAAVWSHHQASDERTEEPIEDDHLDTLARDSSHLPPPPAVTS